MTDLDLPYLHGYFEVDPIFNNEIPTLSAAFIRIGELDKENQSLRELLRVCRTRIDTAYCHSEAEMETDDAIIERIDEALGEKND